MQSISIIIPSHNNLRHLKNAYASIKKHAPEAEVVLYDDASTDGTWEWLEEIKGSDSNLIILKSDTRVGHTVLYDKGIQAATNNIVGIMHADMIMGPNYVERMLKQLRPMTVVCGTRIEPPLHPEGAEKIVRNFGMDFDDLDIPAFEEFALIVQKDYVGTTTRGMFAPWILYKEDFLSIGGHDWGFAPFPYEDSDIFQRWLLNGYNLIQVRDAFVYHLTCRGHRWTGEIGKNDNYFADAEAKARRYYIKKWGSWIKNDHYQHPILIPVYKKCAVITNHTPSDLDDWFTDINPASTEGYDVVVKFDFNKLVTDDTQVITSLNDIIHQTNETGEFEISNLHITINSTKDRSYELIKITNE
jgi:glycosyltransferase involved in cell wall biosynthesis